MNTINKYLNNFECYKPLPPETIKLLLSKAKKGDRVAVSEIIYSHQKFIIFTAKKFGFIHSNIPEDALMDIISAGNVGLLEAINRYDNTRETPFLTCAEFGIRNAIGKNSHENRTGSYLPAAKAKKLSSVKKLLTSYGNENSYENNIITAANELGINIEEIKEILSWDSHETSLETFSDNAKNTLDSFSYNHSESITDEIENNMIESVLHKALNELSNRQKYILCHHYGIDCEKMSLTEIGETLNLSKQRVAQIEKQSLHFLRESSYSKELFEFIA